MGPGSRSEKKGAPFLSDGLPRKIPRWISSRLTSWRSTQVSPSWSIHMRMRQQALDTCRLIKIWRFPKIGLPQQLEDLQRKIWLKWMIWRYHYFRKPPVRAFCCFYWSMSQKEKYIKSIKKRPEWLIDYPGLVDDFHSSVSKMSHLTPSCYFGLFTNGSREDFVVSSILWMNCSGGMSLLSHKFTAQEIFESRKRAQESVCSSQFCFSLVDSCGRKSLVDRQPLPHP